MCKVSIVTATYNSNKYIWDTYSSIQEQTEHSWEWLVTDDCSTDDTLDILEEISAQDNRVRIFKNSTNLGAASARNVSLRHVSGEFIAFIDSDDIWKAEKLHKQINFMGSDVDFSFTAYELVDAQRAPMKRYVDVNNRRRLFNYSDMLKKKATLGCSTVIIRRSAFPDLTMPLIRTGQDYAFWLKLLKSGASAHLFDCILTEYRILPNSISRNKFKKAMRQWQIYRSLEKIDICRSSIYFLHYAWRAVFRR